MKVFDHEVFKMEYGGGPVGENEARIVWEQIRDCGLDHLSAWRTTDVARSSWFVVVADQSGEARQRIDFRGGVEAPMEEAEVYAFLERRLGRAIDAASEGKSEVHDVIRYGRRGAKLRRGGNLDPQVGGDQ